LKYRRNRGRRGGKKPVSAATDDSTWSKERGAKLDTGWLVYGKGSRVSILLTPTPVYQMTGKNTKGGRKAPRRGVRD